MPTNSLLQYHTYQLDYCLLHSALIAVCCYTVLDTVLFKNLYTFRFRNFQHSKHESRTNYPQRSTEEGL